MDHIKPAEKPKANSSESTKVANQNAPAAKPFTTAMESPNRRTVAPALPPVAVESDWSPPVTRTNLPNHIPHPVSTTVDHPKQSAPPTTTNPFQKFLMKQTAQMPSRGRASEHAKNSRDFTDSSSPKPARSSAMGDIGNSTPKHSGLPKELPPSILDRLAKNVVRGKPNRPQYGNIVGSGDLIANLAMKYGKQPVGGAARVQDPMPMKQPPMKPAAAAPASAEHVITEECTTFH